MIDPIILLVIAMVVIVGSIIAIRAHPFLALSSGAILVACLSSSESVNQTEINARGHRIEEISDDGQTLRLRSPKGMSVKTGEYLISLRRYQSDQQRQIIGSIMLSESSQQNEYTYRFGRKQIDSAGYTGKEVRDGDLLVTQADLDAAEVIANRNPLLRVADGFWNICKKLGLLIVFASIIGTCLLESGAADRIVESSRKTFGEERTPAAFTISGFVVGIPVFFDTVFYLMLPLAKALARRSGKNYLLYVLSIVIGATMAHSLVPPTPGPLFVALELDVSIGRMMLAGSIVGMVAAASGYIYSYWANSQWTVSQPDDAQAGQKSTNRSLPPLAYSLLPILLPVVVLGIKTSATGGDNWWKLITPTTALGFAAVLGLLLLVVYTHERDKIWFAIKKSIVGAIPIIMITSIGGAFGYVLRQAGIADAIQHRFPITESGIGLLIIAFAITAVVRFAQGSATVAMITSIGIVAPLAASMELSYDPVYLALAIGCGSKPLPWMNDSGFWVVCKMSGMSERQTLQSFSVTLTIMGFVGFGVVVLGALLFPLQ